MRYLTCVVRPVAKIHPVEELLQAARDVTPVGIHQTKLLDDGTCVTLLQVRGDLDHLESLLADHDAVIEFTIAGDSEGYVYLQTKPHELTRYLIEIQDSTEIIVEMPLEHTGDGGLRGTLVGDDEGFQRALTAVPDALDVEIEATGEYHPDIQDVFANLTGRQQEILETAIRLGYYEDPRRASQQDVAESLDVAPGTVNEHLRRIEVKVFSKYVVGRGDDTG